MKKQPELLAPAGSPEALRAAVECGADAVYLGWGGFNARQSARNFSDEEFSAALEYCHERGVKVYLTLNTLVADRELPAALETARRASALGIDAVLIQDLGLLRLLRLTLPDLPLHASTQMSLFTSGGANFAAEAGCERVVLARECSREEVAAICQNCPAEIEVFVHGALCMCYSGQCAMSALIGGRSGNRGRCAQPCRLPYNVVPSQGAALFPGGTDPLCGGGPLPPAGQGSKNRFPLSLKDNCLAGALGDMSAMGVACLKVEGRMKRPEYVAVVTGVYARLLREGRGPTAAERRALEDAFSRSGFTGGYWTGHTGPEMFGTRPENAPEPKALFAAAKSAVEKGGLRTVPISMACTVRAGVPCSLAVSDGLHTVSASGPVPETARNRALTAEELQARLGKTGGTAYTCRQIEVSLEDGLSLPAAAVNGLRREALAALSRCRTAPPHRRELPPPPPPENACAAGEPEFTCSVSRMEQLTAALVAQRPARIYIPLALFRHLKRLPEGDTRWFAVLPRVWRNRDEPLLLELLERARALGVRGVLLGNLGHLPLTADCGLERCGDFGLNAFNAHALDFLKDKGLTSVTASFELRSSQLHAMAKPLPVEAIVYGRLPLMITENCPIRSNGGCRCGQGMELLDRTGAHFPLLPAWGHRCEIQNSRVLYLADQPEYRYSGLSYARLRFTTETAEECVRVFCAYRSGAPAPAEFTRGLFQRGVE